MIKLKSPSAIFTSVPKFIFFFLFCFLKMRCCQKLWLKHCAETAHLHDTVGQCHILCLQFSYLTYVARLLNKEGGISDLEGKSCL